MFKAPENLKVMNGKEIELKQEESFVIPSYVTKLDDWLFRCSNFKSISFETTSLKELPESCFCFCYELKEITIPNGITKLGNECFSNCISLSRITIPSSLVELGEYCFAYCDYKKLKSIELPSTITKFGKGCFFGSGIKQEEYSNLSEHCWKSPWK